MVFRFFKGGGSRQEAKERKKTINIKKIGTPPTGKQSEASPTVGRV